MDRGVYLLFVQLWHREHIDIGSLGTFEFGPGLYCYVGSGMNGLDSRVERHKKIEKKNHWHIDYLLQEGEIVSVLKLPTTRDLECRLNGLVSELSSETPVGGFGSSDCGCEAHFHLLTDN